MDCGSDDGEENRDPDPIIDYAPIESGTEGLTVDAKVASILEEWEAPMVDEVDTPSVLKGVPNIVETMARIVNMAGVEPTERFKFLVLGRGITPTIDGVIASTVSGLMLSEVKEIVEATLEDTDPSISSGGAACPNVGLPGSK